MHVQRYQSSRPRFGPSRASSKFSNRTAQRRKEEEEEEETELAYLDTAVNSREKPQLGLFFDTPNLK